MDDLKWMIKYITDVSKNENELSENLLIGTAFLGLKTAMEQSIENYYWPNFRINNKIHDKAAYYFSRKVVGLFSNAPDLLPDPYDKLYAQLLTCCHINENMIKMESGEFFEKYGINMNQILLDAYKKKEENDNGKNG